MGGDGWKEMRLVRLVLAVLTSGSGVLSMIRLGFRKLISGDGGRSDRAHKTVVQFRGPLTRNPPPEGQHSDSGVGVGVAVCPSSGPVLFKP